MVKKSSFSPLSSRQSVSPRGNLNHQFILAKLKLKIFPSLLLAFQFICLCHVDVLTFLHRLLFLDLKISLKMHAITLT